jgi:hypothetical protein
MASVTFSIPDNVKEDMESISWVNWSELAREEAHKRAKLAREFETFKKITAKSKLTEKDARELDKKIKSAAAKRFIDANHT